MKRLRYENGPLDSVDERLLAALCADARISLAKLARQVGLSAPSVAERLRRLEEADVIQGYAPRINPKALGRPIGAWLRIRPVQGQLQKVLSLLKELPEIVSCDRISGEDCFIACAHLETLEDLERLIDEIIPYATTNTAIIQSSPIPLRPPPLSLRP